MRRDLTTSVLALILLTIVLGLAYPLLTTGVAQLAYPNKSDGSQIAGAGSRLIGRDFSKDLSLFQARPSATGYSADVTAFGNLGPNSRDLATQTRKALHAYLKRERPFTHGLTAARVPAEAVQQSASGVDPHISPADARIQARRVAARRNLPLRDVLALVEAHTDDRSLGVLGEPGVNVLELDLDLEKRR